MSPRVPQICLVSREVFPLTGGGIGSYVTALAGLLRNLGQVRVITSDAYRERWEELEREGDERLPDGLLWTFVPEPRTDRLDDWFGFHHCWSAAVLEAIEREYGHYGPDLIEFPDYHAEGFVTAQAKRAGHRTVRDTNIVLRAHTSFEMCRTLDGWVGNGPEERSILALERATFGLADALLWAGGDVWRTYERFYGSGALPRGVRVRHPLTFTPPDEVDETRWEVGYPLSLLYVGRLERRKGVRELLRGLTRNDSDGWNLTFVGGDTETGPLGVSQRAQLELMALGDERVKFIDSVPRQELVHLIRRHHALVMPSRWECWPTVVLEALSLNRPVVATPTGGMLEMVREGAGWLAKDTTPTAFCEAIDPLIGELKAVERLIQAGSPRAAAADLVADDAILDTYATLVDRPSTPARRSRRPDASKRAAPLVSVIVPYFQLGEFLPDALRSVADQTYPLIETVIVNDGSRSAGDAEVLGRAEELAGTPVRILTQTNSGLGAARMAGVWQSRGRYVLPLDADNVIHPSFVARCVEILEADPALAYVTCWSRFIDSDGEPLSWPDTMEPRGYHPLGNRTALVEELNVAGDALAMIPRRLFDLGFAFSRDVPVCEDWTLYRALHRAGRFGAVIPERLTGYRVRPDSMYQTGAPAHLTRIAEEATAQLDEEAIAWTP